MLLVVYSVLILVFVMIAAAEIPVNKSCRLRVGPLQDAVAFAIDSAEKSTAVLGQMKTALAKLFRQVFPRAAPPKDLQTLLGSFWADGKDDPIDSLKRRQRVLSATTTFQLLMGHGVKADFAELTKYMPVDEEGELVSLGEYVDAARECAMNLTDLVDREKAKKQAELDAASTPAGPSSGKSPKP